MSFSRAQSAYDAATLSLLQQAYDEACRERGIDPRSGDQDGHEARETLAKAVMHVAAMGVRDPRLLRDRAIQAVMQPEADAQRYRSSRRLQSLERGAN
jgi:hypothetical protein